MRRTARRTPQARRDVRDIAKFIARDNMDAALRFLEAVDDAGQKLASMPGMGSHPHFLATRARDVRFWPIKGFENYLIFYRPSDRGIEVVRVVHGARDIDAMFEGA